jgi:hypothetical protein
MNGFNVHRAMRPDGLEARVPVAEVLAGSDARSWSEIQAFGAGCLAGHSEPASGKSPCRNTSAGVEKVYAAHSFLEKGGQPVQLCLPSRRRLASLRPISC